MSVSCSECGQVAGKGHEIPHLATCSHARPFGNIVGTQTCRFCGAAMTYGLICPQCGAPDMPGLVRDDLELRRQRDADKAEIVRLRKMLWSGVRAVTRRARKPAWGHVADTFSIGSTSAIQLCREMGIDPYTGKELEQGK